MCDSHLFNLHQEDESYTCSICLDVVEDKVIHLNKCNHHFHQKCIKAWYAKSNTCPLCRSEIIDIFKAYYRKSDSIFRKKKQIAIQLLENKIVFYKVKKNDIVLNNNFDNMNLVNQERDRDTDRNNNYNDATLNLANINYLAEFKNDEICSEVKFQILYQDIKAVMYNNKCCYFHNLVIKKNILNAQRGDSNQKIKVQFKNKNLCRLFFNTLKKRHKYFRQIN